MNNTSELGPSEQTRRFLQLKARPGQPMESWLFNEFPRGLKEIARTYDAEAMPYKKECVTLFDNRHIGDMSFADPRFDGEFAAIEKACKHVKYGAKAEVFDRLRSQKGLFDTVSRQKHFFEDEFFPRLRELAQGTPVDSSDYELFFMAREYGNQLWKQYNRHVPEQFKPDDNVLKDFLTYTSKMLGVVPKPSNWKLRVEKLRNPPDFDKDF